LEDLQSSCFNGEGPKFAYPLPLSEIFVPKCKEPLSFPRQNRSASTRASTAPLDSIPYPTYRLAVNTKPNRKAQTCTLEPTHGLLGHLLCRMPTYYAQQRHPSRQTPTPHRPQTDSPQQLFPSTKPCSNSVYSCIWKDNVRNISIPSPQCLNKGQFIPLMQYIPSGAQHGQSAVNTVEKKK
jgi:hypothetical protein